MPGSRQLAVVVRCLPVPSAGAASGASTCSSPPALASPCWSSGGGKSGSVTSALGAGVVVAGSVGVDSLGADGLGAGVAVAGFDLRGAALADRIKQTQLYHRTSRKELNVHHATRCKLTASISS
jgi:hypothetical protein